MPPRVALSFYRRYQPVRLLGQGSRYAWAWRSCRRRVGPSGDRQSGTDQVEKSRKGDSRNHGTRHSHRREPCGRASRRTGDHHGSGDPPFVPLPPHRWDYHESEEVRFATVSPLEGAGFEPSVPLYGELGALGRVRRDPRRHREARNARLFASTRSASDLRHAWGALPWYGTPASRCHRPATLRRRVDRRGAGRAADDRPRLLPAAGFCGWQTGRQGRHVPMAVRRREQSQPSGQAGGTNILHPQRPGPSV
jgi:hypothetical protein